VGGAERLPHNKTHPFQIQHHIARRKPQRGKTLARQNGVPHRIMKLGVFGAMLAAIHLDHEPRPKTHEIQKILLERRLPAKMPPLRAQTPQK